MRRNGKTPAQRTSTRDYSRNIAVHMTEEQYQRLERYRKMTRHSVTTYFRKLIDGDRLLGHCFQPENHGVTPDSAIRTEYLLKQALKAGYTTAAITVAVQLAPEIYKAIDYLIKHGEIDVQRIRKIGEKGISSGAEGFLRGSVSSALLIMCEKGALGEAFRGISPTAMGTVVALVMQTVKNSVLVAAGEMTAQQMGAAFVDTVVVSGGDSA